MRTTVGDESHGCHSASACPARPMSRVTLGPRTRLVSAHARPTRWGILATGRIARALANDLRGSGRRDRRRRLALAESGGRVRRGVRRRGAPTRRTRRWWRTPTSTSCTSPRRTPFHLRTPGWRSTPASPCCARAAHPQPRGGRGDGGGGAAEPWFLLMEAMWMACNPVIREIRDGIRGRFGTPRQVHADLGFIVSRRQPDVQPRARRRAPCSTWASTVRVRAPDARTGRQPRRHGDLERPGRRPRRRAGRPAGEAVSALTASMTSTSPCTATIATTDGRIDMSRPASTPPSTPPGRRRAPPERIAGLEPFLGTGLGNEAAHVQECLHAAPRDPLVPRPDADPDPPDGRRPPADRGQLPV